MPCRDDDRSCGRGGSAIDGLSVNTPIADLPTDGVPIRQASTVMLVDDRPDLHVLALRRAETSTFVAGHTLFPGGAVDTRDHDSRWGSLAITPSSNYPGLVGTRALRIAAVRETIEEVGLVLGITDTANAEALAARRYDLAAGQVSLADLAAELAVNNAAVVDLSVLHPVARWVTPMPSNKRYDTAFFIAQSPSGGHAEVDGREAVHAEWCRPRDVLARWSGGELTMMSPTLSMFQRLATYTTADEVLSAATVGGPVLQVSLRNEIADLVDFEGDPGFDRPDVRRTLGWVWLNPGPN